MLDYGSGSRPQPLNGMPSRFLIQRSNRRDSLAVQAKLDELLRAHAEARGELAELDDEEPEEIEKHREQERHKI